MVDAEPLVSVICPVYNSAPWLDECIGSVLAQSLQDWELILIDDASADDSLAICERYAAADARMRVVRGQGGAGAGANRNLGLDLARGRYVFFLDSDDYLTPHALERIAGECEANGLDGLFFGAHVLCEDPSLQHKVEGYEAYYAKPVEGLKVGSGRDMLLFMLQEKCFAVTPGLQFWRRSALENAGVRYPEGVIYEDNAFSVDACLAAHAAGMMPEKLFVRRVRQGSIMHDAGRTLQKDFRSNFQVGVRVLAAALAHAEDQELSRALSRFANIFLRRAYRAYAEGIGAGRTFNVAWMDAAQMAYFTAFFRSHREEIREAARLREGRA